MREIMETRPARLKMTAGETTLNEAYSLALANIAPETGWLLAESPEKFLLSPLTSAPDVAALGDALSLIVFGPAAELRFSRAYGALTGRRRLIVEDETAEEGMERLSSYLLRDGRLEYAEYFREDPESGLLRPRFGRYLRAWGM